MHITKLSLVNYRNFKNVKLLFNKGINTVIGENASGKTNLFRAIRLLLDNSMPRSATKLNENDFCRNLGNWQGHWIIISIEFNNIASDEASQSLFLHGVGNAEDNVVTRATYNLIFRPKAYARQALAQLTIGDTSALESYLADLTIDDYESVLTGKSVADFNDPATYTSIVGDFESVVFPSALNNPDIGIRLPNILNMPNEVSFTFIKALRDVVSDFHSNRTNPLLTLLKSKSGDISAAEFGPIASLIGTLNDEIEGLSDICAIRDDIVTTVGDTVGDTYSPSSISIRSSLTDESDQLFQSLKLFIGESGDGHEGSIHEMSLGGANLLYLTLKLLEFKYQKENQSIANFLLIEEPEAHIHTHLQKSLFDNINYENTQIIYSTHSSHISEVSNIKNMNIIGLVNGKPDVFQPSLGLDDEQVAMLFDEQRVKKRCSIITDLDEAFFDISILDTDDPATKKKKEKALGSQETGMARKGRLDVYCLNNPWVSTYYAEHTFEVDFIKSGNSQYIQRIIQDIYTQQTKKDTASTELGSTDVAISGARALTMANYQGKGWFALTLGKVIDFKVTIPDYIFNAIKFAHGNFNAEITLKILKHRYKSIINHINYGKETIQKLESEGNLSLKQEWEAYLAPYENGIRIFSPKLEAFNSMDGNINTLKEQMINDLPSENNDILSRI